MLREVFKKYGSDDYSGFGLREIKFGRSRLNILNAFLKAMTNTDYEQILIKDLCKSAEVSEPSFYNYFPRKDDLFIYFISLWSVDVQLHVSHEKKGLDTIRNIFAYTAKQIVNSAIPLMKEIISYQAKTNVEERAGQIKAVSHAEKVLVFGNLPGLEKIPDQGLGQILQLNLIEALKSGELPAGTNLETIGLILGSLFFGLPVILLHSDSNALEASFQSTLDFIFKNSKINI